MTRLLLALLVLSSLHGLGQVGSNCFKGCSRRGTGSAARAAFLQDDRMNNYDIKGLFLDITVHPANNFITATCRYTISAIQPIDTFAIELMNNISLDSVKVATAKAVFARRNNHVYVALPAAATIGASLQVSFYYQGVVSNGFFSGSDINGLRFTASVSESFQARNWFPAKQLLDDKIDSTDIWITTDSGYTTGSNGLLQGVNNMPGNLRQYRWRCRYPLSYYMPSVAVGNYQEYDLYAKPAAIAPDSILVQNQLVNNTAFFNSRKLYIDKTPRLIELFSDLFGLYPFYKEKYGHAMAAIGGGMEHATMTTLSDFDDQLIPHELAHQWFGDNVTCATWKDIWLNEGFATYGQYLACEKLPSLFSQSAARFMADLHTQVMAVPTGSVYVSDQDAYDENRIFNYRLTYAKGASAVHNLRFELQNDSVFFNLLKTWQRRHKDNFATTADLKSLAEELSGKNLDNFFNQRVYGEGFPTYSVSYYRYGTDSLVLQVTQSASTPAVTPLFTGLLPLKIRSATGDTNIIVDLKSANEQFRIAYSGTPAAIDIDPDNWIVNATGTIAKLPDVVPAVTDVKVYPVPAANIFNIYLPANRYQFIRLLDAGGRLLASYRVAANTYRLQPATPPSPGVYFLQFVGDKESKTIGVVVAR